MWSHYQFIYVLSIFEGPTNYLLTLDSWEIYQSVPYNPKVARNFKFRCVLQNWVSIFVENFMWCLKCFHFTQCVTIVQCTERFSLTCVLSDCFHCPKHHSLLQPPIFLSHMPHFQWHLLHVELSGQYSNPKDNANGKCMFSKKAACLQILTLPLNNLSTNFNALLFHKLNLQSGVMYKFIEHSGVPIFKIHKDISTLQN